MYIYMYMWTECTKQHFRPDPSRSTLNSSPKFWNFLTLASSTCLLSIPLICLTSSCSCLQLLCGMGPGWVWLIPAKDPAPWVTSRVVTAAAVFPRSGSATRCRIARTGRMRIPWFAVSTAQRYKVQPHFEANPEDDFWPVPKLLCQCLVVSKTRPPYTIKTSGQFLEKS